MRLRRQALTATASALAISGMLFVSAYATGSALLSWPQAPGFWITAILRGIHSASKIDYALITIPVNALIYSLIIFGIMSLPFRKD